MSRSLSPPLQRSGEDQSAIDGNCHDAPTERPLVATGVFPPVPSRLPHRFPIGRSGLYAVVLSLLGVAVAAASPEQAFFVTKTASEAPRLAFDLDSVTIEGVTPGGEVILLGLMRTRVRHSYTRFERVELEEVDLDEDGVVRFELEEEIAPLAAFAVVDLETGEAAIAGPGEIRLRELRPGDRRIPRGRDDAIEIDRRRLTLVWVRPKTAAWRLSLRDGTAEDDRPGADGRVIAATAAFRPTGQAHRPPPPSFRPGDTLVAIDDRTLAFSIFRFEAGQ